MESDGMALAAVAAAATTARNALAAKRSRSGERTDE
jgi:hypothetical protein